MQHMAVPLLGIDFRATPQSRQFVIMSIIAARVQRADFFHAPVHFFPVGSGGEYRAGAVRVGPAGACVRTWRANVAPNGTSRGPA